MDAIVRTGVRAVLVSGNRKLGLASATYVAQGSCPPGCRFRDAGCYAEHGYVGFQTRRLNRESRGRSHQALAEAEADALSGMPPLLDLRFHVVGDTRSPHGARLLAAQAARWEANGRRAWGYTHATRVKRRDWGSASILGSCEDMKGMRSMVRRGFVPAIVVDRFPSRSFSLGGIRFIACPYQTLGTQCVECRLCLDDGALRDKGLGIAFESHGQGKGRISLPMVEAA